MAKNRKEAEDFFLKVIRAYPSKEAEANAKVYGEYFKSLSDKQFEEMIERFESGEDTLRFSKKNFVGDNKEDIVGSFKPVFKIIGYPIMQRYVYTDPDSGEKTVMKWPALNLYLPNRSLNQIIAKKRGVPKGNSTDALTGQPTGKAKGATFSAPEQIVTAGKGHHFLALDLIKVRGGDERAYQLSRNQIYNDGEYSINEILEQETNVTSVVIADVMLTAMHFKNNLWQDIKIGKDPGNKENE